MNDNLTFLNDVEKVPITIELPLPLNITTSDKLKRYCKYLSLSELYDCIEKRFHSYS